MTKITDKDVLRIRKLAARHPEFTRQQIKDTLKLQLSADAIGRTARGILHAGVDMAGLKVRPTTPSGYAPRKGDSSVLQFSEKLVREAESLKASGKSHDEIAARFHVRPSAISFLLAV